MMLACVIIELTDDASLVAPVGAAAIISMMVGNYFNHGAQTPPEQTRCTARATAASTHINAQAAATTTTAARHVPTAFSASTAASARPDGELSVHDGGRSLCPWCAGLYHGLIAVKNLPFLNPVPSDVMWLVPVEDVMVKSIIMLAKRVRQTAQRARRTARTEQSTRARARTDVRAPQHRPTSRRSSS